MAPFRAHVCDVYSLEEDDELCDELDDSDDDDAVEEVALDEEEESLDEEEESLEPDGTVAELPLLLSVL